MFRKVYAPKLFESVVIGVDVLMVTVAPEITWLLEESFMSPVTTDVESSLVVMLALLSMLVDMLTVVEFVSYPVGEAVIEYVPIAT